RFVVCFLLVTLLAGCKYDRSFLNMNSDSGSPFLGLQWSVDADAASEATQLVSRQPAESVLEMRTGTTRAQSPEWASAGMPAVSAKSGEFSNSLGAVEADEHPLTAVGRRLAAF
ncbi:MAG: hypothetical protein ABGZ35_03995, partial [Planctomycetaceae bacterium]